MGRRFRRPKVAVATAVLATVVAGCASVPTSGPVVPGEGSGGDDNGEGAGGYVRMLPAGPQPEVGEQALVQGFLRDMSSFEENHHAARLYLMPGPQESWAPEGEVVVYDDADNLVFDTDVSPDEETATVRMRGNHVASISGDGQYQPQNPDEAIDVTFKLAKDDGEWRIDELPDSLILGRSDVQRAYRPLNLYFFNRDNSTLVADPILLPVSRENMATHLVRTLVGGPTAWLDPAVQSAFPEGTTADVAYDSGNVTVELSGSVSSGDRYEMAAQLGWTLKQLPEVQELALRIDGEEIELPGGDAENLQGAGNQWGDVDPGGISGSPNAYFRRDSQLWSISAEGELGEVQEAPAEGAPGEGGTPMREHAVSLSEDQVAGIGADGESVVVADMQAGSSYSTVLEGGEYSALSWGPDDNLWVIEQESTDDSDDDNDQGDDESGGEDTSGSTLWRLPDGGDPVEVHAPELEDAVVSTLRISRDGTRAAVISEHDDGPRLYVGRVTETDGEMSVDGLVPFALDLNAISDVTWRSGDELAVLGQKEQEAVQAFLVSLDGGSETTSAGAPTGAEMGSLSAAPGVPMFSGADEDQMWSTNDRVMWRFVADGSDPVYPG